MMPFHQSTMLWCKWCLSISRKKKGVTIQIKNFFAPYATGVHCHAHKINLDEKTLSKLPVFHVIEDLIQVSHAYFLHLPKKYNEYKAFASTINTKGQKLLMNVTTCLLSLLKPMKHLKSELRIVWTK
jgi:hypothetical protein